MGDILRPAPWRACAALAAMMVLLLGMTCTAATLADDPALTKPITLAVKGQTLSEIIAEIRLQTGAHLSVPQQEAGDMLATVYVDNMPAAKVMNGIARLFSLEWRIRTLTDYTSYDLVIPGKTLQAAATVRQRAWDALKENIRHNLDLEKLPQEELQERFNTLWMATRKAGPHPTPTDDSALEDLLYNAPTLQRAVDDLYQRLTDSQKAALFADKYLCFDTNATQPEWQLPGDFPHASADLDSFDQHSQLSIKAPATPVAGVNVQMWCEETDDAGVCKAQVVDYSTKGKGISQWPLGIGGVDLRDLLPSPTMKFGGAPKGTPLDQTLTLTKQELAAEAAIPWQSLDSQPLFVNRSDILALVHKRLHIPIISDHFDVWFDSSAWHAGPVREALNGLDKSSPLQGEQFAVWEWRDSVLYVRAEDPDYASRGQIPSGLLRTLKQSYASNGHLTLSDLASVLKLPQQAVDALMKYSPFMGLGWRDEYDDFQIEGRFFKLYSLLTPEQLREASAGTLRVGYLTPSQQQQLLQTLRFDWVQLGDMHFPREGEYDTSEDSSIPTALPVTISFTQKTESVYLYGYLQQRPKQVWDTRFLDMDPDVNGESTLEGMWAAALQKDRHADKHQLARHDMITCTFTMTWADGHTRQLGERYYVFVPYDKLPEKLPYDEKPETSQPRLQPAG